MLGQPVSMLIPEVVGFRLTGELPEGATATDLVLTVTQMLRQRRVVSKFVEFFGPGLEPAAGRSRDHRQHVAGVWRDVRVLPRGRGDAALPEVHRSRGRAGGAGRGLLPRAGPVPRGGLARTEVLRHARARSRDRGAEPGRPASAAGPRGPQRRSERLPRGAAHVRQRRGLPGVGQVRGVTFPASDPPSSKAEGVSPKPMPAHRGDGAPVVRTRRRRRGHRTTARWSSPRSRAARTRRTRRSCSAPGCSPARPSRRG